MCVCPVCACVCPSVSAACPSVRLTQLEKPALAVRVEEGMSEVIAVVLRDGEGLALDAVEEVLSPEKRAEDRAVMSSPVRSLSPAGPVWPGNSPCQVRVPGPPALGPEQCAGRPLLRETVPSRLTHGPCHPVTTSVPVCLPGWVSPTGWGAPPGQAWCHNPQDSPRAWPQTGWQLLTDQAVDGNRAPQLSLPGPCCWNSRRALALASGYLG